MIHISKFKRFFYGLIIGIAAVTPGVSGGVIAAAYGIYEPSVYAISDFRKNPGMSFSWLYPIATGILAGILIFARILLHLIKTNYVTVMVIFCGLVFGSVPSLIKESKGEISRKKYIIFFSVSFLTCLYLSLYINNFTLNAFSSAMKWLLIGCIVSAGTVIPGISSSFILIKLGLYDMYIGCLGGNEIAGAIAVAFSFIVTTCILFKGIEILFRNFRGYAYSLVTGFLTASAVAVFPDIGGTEHIFGYILLFMISILCGYLLVKGK